MAANLLRTKDSNQDTIMVLQLMAASVPYRFPPVKYVVPHFGGLIPMPAARVEQITPRSAPSPFDQR